MTFTYDPETLNVPIAQVRSRIGDTDKARAILSDEEIKQVLTERGLSLTVALSNQSANDAAFVACERAIARLARDVDRSNLGMTASTSQKIANLEKVCDRLGAALARSGAKPFVGGVSKSEKDTLAADTDFTGPKISRDQNAHRSGSSDDLDRC